MNTNTELKQELEEIEKRLKSDFVSPKDMRRRDEIRSLIMTDGKQSDLVFKAQVGRTSSRVTSFTRDQR